MQFNETVESVHSANFKNLMNQKFDRLLVVSYAGRRDRDGLATWLCRCDCGNEVVVVGKQLRRKQTRSCGCLQIEISKAVNRKHGMRGTRIYRIWSGMLDRTTNPNSKDSDRYSDRGIKVCERWLKFENFFEDMGLPPSDSHSLERKDNNGNYELANCCWATAEEQANNRSNNRLVTFGNVTYSIAKWARLLGKHTSTIGRRLDRGCSVFEALTGVNI